MALEYVDQTIGTLPVADRRELTRLLGELGASLSRALADSDDPSSAAHERPDAAAGVAGDPREPGAAA